MVVHASDAATRSCRGSDATEPAARGPSARIRLFVERVAVWCRSAAGVALEERELPVLSLAFDYGGGVVVRSTDPSERFFRASASGLRPEVRDTAAEADAQRVLEGLGAIEIACLDDVGTSPGSEADYLVAVDGDEHDYCAFSSTVVPALEARGFEVEIAHEYPYRVVAEDGEWYAALEESGRDAWFELELGVEVAGQRVNLLPALIALIEGTRGKSFGALARRSLRRVALPVGDGTWVTLPKERLEAIVQVVVELHRGVRGRTDMLAFPELSARALERLTEAFAGARRPLVLTGGGAARARGRIVERVASRALCDAPPGLVATLRPYQREGVAWLSARAAAGEGAVLADDMGLGKTLQLIAHLLVERARRPGAGPSLVVTPTTLVSTWMREMARFAPSLRTVALVGSRRRAMYDALATGAPDTVADVAVTTYPLLLRDAGLLTKCEFHLVALDEAHTIKNGRSRVHAAATGLRAAHRVCLTGTPMENHLGELWALFDFVEPGAAR